MVDGQIIILKGIFEMLKIFSVSVLSAAAFVLAAAEKVYPVFFKQDPGIVIDGRLSRDDWSDIKNEIKVVPGKGKQNNSKSFPIKGEKDISAAVKFAYRYDGLYFGFNVTDDKHRQKCTGAEAFKGDHVEVLIDLQPTLGEKGGDFGPKQFQILFSPGSLDGKIKPESYMYAPVKQNISLPIAAQKTASGYTLEVLVPWSVLGIKKQPSSQLEKTIGFDILISDTDGEAPYQEKYLYLGKIPFARKRGRLQLAYLSDSRGTIPADLNAAGGKILVKNLRLDGKKRKADFIFDYDNIRGAVPVLKFNGYNISSSRNYAGCGAILRLKVNGKPVSGVLLRNKPNQVLTKKGQKYNFVTAADRIYLPYLKSFKDLPSYGHRYYIFRDRQDWCSFEFDISTLVKKGKNEVTADILVFKKGKLVYPVFINELSFAYSGTPSRVKKGAPTGKIPTITPAKILPTQAKFTADEAKKEIAVIHNGEKYLLKSYWSVPEGRMVTNSNKYFKLKREIIRKKELMVIKDTVKNISGLDLPVKHFHEITVPTDSTFYINSFEVSKSMRDFIANHANSSTFVKQKKGGLGLFPLDDVTRVHAENYVKSATTAGLADRTLVLPPGKSLVTEIAVIPARGDYFDFLNILRRELDVNFTLKGTLIPLNNWWFYLNVWNYSKDWAKSVRQLRDIVKYTDAHYAWAFLGFSGTNMNIAIDGSNRPLHPREYYKKDMKASQKLYALLKEAAPGLSTSVYYHCFLDYWPESEKLYSDDAVINAYGEKEQYFKSTNPNKSSGIYLPTLTNKFGKACTKRIESILKDHRQENSHFYWDEFTSCKVAYSYNPRHWDGLSGDIDPQTHKLLRKKSSLCLMSGDFRHAMVKKIKAAGEDVMVNSQPRLRRLMKEKLMSFTETANIDNCARVQVYTPIQLGDHLVGSNAADPAVIYRQMLEGLDFGVLYYYYHLRYVPDHHTLTQYMFPITPVELHRGYIIGKEKIVTKKSGLYGWNDTSKHEVHVYDDKGWPAKNFKAPFKNIKGKTYSELRLPEDYSAVIIRR